MPTLLLAVPQVDIIITCGAISDNKVVFMINSMFSVHLVITVSADGLAPNGARPSAGTVLTHGHQYFEYIFAYEAPVQGKETAYKRLHHFKT